MSHFAKIENGVVADVIVANQDFIDSGVVGNPSEWIQTSYNTYGGQHPENRPLRKNYAGVGFTYDRLRDAFIPPQPYPSWILDEESCLWTSPVPRPVTDEINFRWDEPTVSWVVLEDKPDI